MAINKSLNIGVKRAHKQGDWLGFDAVEVIPKELKDVANSTTNKVLFGVPVNQIAKSKIDKIEKLLATEGAKINESIDNDTMDDQIAKLSVWRDSEKAKADNTKKAKPFNATQVANYNEQNSQYEALDLIVNAMKKERKLRDAVDAQIASAKSIDTLEEWNKIKNIWRSTEQKKTILDNIRRVEAAVKSSEEAAKVEAAKQAKLNELNNKMATTTDPNEKKAIAAQISALMGSVSTETGLPKGALYIGIGVAVVVGIWITLRAIRK